MPISDDHMTFEDAVLYAKYSQRVDDIIKARLTAIWDATEAARIAVADEQSRTITPDDQSVFRLVSYKYYPADDVSEDRYMVIGEKECYPEGVEADAKIITVADMVNPSRPAEIHDAAVVDIAKIRLERQRIGEWLDRKYWGTTA